MNPGSRPQVNPDSYADRLVAVQAFHSKHQLRDLGGEDLLYRLALMTDELGEISECVTKGKTKAVLAEELADLLILLVGTGIAADLDLKQAFWEKMTKLQHRRSRLINGRIRVSEFQDSHT